MENTPIDNNAEVLAFGNSNLPAGTKDRPLVTFALFAYNQEQYIREAVEGAFAQTYTPLEIILSDDCSSDGTFAIIKEMSKAYIGNHYVKIVRHGKNLGLLNHLLLTARHASGCILVPAAGDDISYPNRVQALSEALTRSQAIAAYSRHDEISQDGLILGRNLLFPTSLPGFAAAYKTEFWAKLPFASRKMIAEDGLATCIIRIRGLRVEQVNETLVAYRILANSLSMRGEPLSASKVWHRERALACAGEELIERICYLYQHAYGPAECVDKDFVDHLARDWIYARIISGFWGEKFIARFRFLFFSCDAKSISYVLPRLLGRRVFLIFRLIVSTLRTGRIAPIFRVR